MSSVDRLEPAHLVEQAKENVREATIGRVEETAKGVSDMVMETIKRNPIPAALAGAGLALLWATDRRDPSPETRRTEVATATRAGLRRCTSQRAVASARRRRRPPRRSWGVGTAAEGAQQMTGEVIDRAGETAQQVGWKLESFMKANPLAVGPSLQAPGR